MIFKLIQKGWEWLFPFYCLGCQAEDNTVCQACLDSVKKFPENSCPYCQKIETLEGKFCNVCQTLVPFLDGALIGFIYEKGGLLSQILHKYKYQSLSGYSKVLSYLLSKMLADDDMVQLTYVPLSKKKLAIRGFNHIELILKNLKKGEALLSKKKETAAQMTLGAEERKKNLRNVFEVRPEIKLNETIWIFDDIATTFSTLNEAAKVLKMAGASKVFGIVLAREKVL